MPPLPAATADALAAAFRAAPLGWATAGAAAGALLAVAPGLSATAILALLLPLADRLGALPGAVLLCAAYGGAQFGVALRAMLLVQPISAGVNADLDGALLARQGRAAWGVLAAALASFVAAGAGLALLALGLPPLQRLVGDLGPAEAGALAGLVLVGAVVCSGGSLRKSMAMAALGVLLAIGGVGVLPAGWTLHALPRGLAADRADAIARLHFVVLAMGLVGFGGLMWRAGQPQEAPGGRLAWSRTTAREWHEAAGAALRGIAFGWPIGLLPGSGSRLAAYLAHRAEQRRAVPGTPALGKGDVRGVAGPRAARQAAALAALLATWSVGVPFSTATAVLHDGALLQPALHPPAFWWTLLAALMLAHAALLVLALPLAAMAQKLAAVPRGLLVALLVLAGCYGIYAIRGEPGDVYGLAACALVAHVLRLLRCNAGPLLLGYAIGPVLDDNLGRALQVLSGDWRALSAQPVVWTSVGVAGAVLLLCAMPAVAAQRRRAFS